MGRVENKVAIVTGAAGGMGAVEAKLLAKEGAKVLITDVQEEKLKVVVKEIKSAGGIAEYITHDVTSVESWKAIAEKAIGLFKKIDVLVNNAGILGNVMLPMQDRTVAEFNKVIAVNLLGQFIGMKTVIPFMRDNGGGSIVNISSIAGLTGNAGANAYTASKGGSRMLSKGAAVEFAKDKIRVNSVHPGYVATPMTQNMTGASDFQKTAVALTPLGRGAEMEEIAYGVLFPASDESSYITGLEMAIDGGFTAL